MLSSRLPTELIARLLLALLLVCNLTLCVSWSAFSTASAPAASTMTEADATLSVTSCHSAVSMAKPDAAGVPGAQASGAQDDCQMHDGLTPSGTTVLLLLTALLALPLLLPSLLASPLLDNWLRDPLLRLRGTHPPSWPRRHLMLSVLRH